MYRNTNVYNLCSYAGHDIDKPGTFLFDLLGTSLYIQLVQYDNTMCARDVVWGKTRRAIPDTDACYRYTNVYNLVPFYTFMHTLL